MEKATTLNETHPTIHQAKSPQQIPSMSQRHGNTMYDIFIHFNSTATQTFSDKVLKLIKNDTKTNKIS